MEINYVFPKQQQILYFSSEKSVILLHFGKSLYSLFNRRQLDSDVCFGAEAYVCYLLEIYGENMTSHK